MCSVWHIHLDGLKFWCLGSKVKVGKTSCSSHSCECYISARKVFNWFKKEKVTYSRFCHYAIRLWSDFTGVAEAYKCMAASLTIVFLVAQLLTHSSLLACSSFWICLCVCAGVWEDGRSAVVWWPVLWSLSPPVYRPVSGSEGKVPLSWMQIWWVPPPSPHVRPKAERRLSVRMKRPSTYVWLVFCFFQASTRASCVSSLATGSSAAWSRCAGSSITPTVYWPSQPHSRITRASAALCMCVCPATSPTLSTSALKVRSSRAVDLNHVMLISHRV